MIQPEKAPSSARYLLRTKTCRSCAQPLLVDGKEESFPVSGVGTMHNRCALSYCQQRGLTLEQATPVCKHWRSRGFCIYESTCFYKHPPEARGAPKPPPGQPTAADIAAKAAAWRAINAASLQGQSSPASRADAAAPPTAVDISNGFSYAPAEKAPSSHADQAATDSAEAPAWGDEAAAQSARPNGTSCSNSCNRSEEVYQQPAAAGEDGAPLGAERARSGVLEEIARSSATGDVARSGVCAGGARSGESGQIARSGVRASPDLAAMHAASYAARAVRRGPAKRNKVKNRFRAGVFRRFLLDTFGRERLASGSGVLDIAGGKGELAFELVNLNNIPATVVEPRPLKLAKQELWLKGGFYHRNSIFQRYVDVPLEKFLEAGAVTPPQLRMVVSEALCAGIAAADISSTDISAGDVSAGDVSRAAPAAADISGTSGAAPEDLMAGHADSPMAGDHARLDGGTEDSTRGSADATGSHREGCIGVKAVSENGMGHASCRGADSQNDSCTSDGARADAAEDSSGHSSTAAIVRTDRCGDEGSDEGRSNPLKAMLEESFRLAMDTRWTHKGVEHEGNSARVFADVAADDSEDESEAFPDTDAVTTESAEILKTCVPDLERVIDTWQRSSILVGMHPDQATEVIVDFAQRMRKPFAVVPCCVYAAEFPQRQLLGGTPVRTHDDLIAYIIARDPAAVRVRELPFEGRNKVVYVVEWSANDRVSSSAAANLADVESS